jgi:hypothetical protein
MILAQAIKRHFPFIKELHIFELKCYTLLLCERLFSDNELTILRLYFGLKKMAILVYVQDNAQDEAAYRSCVVRCVLNEIDLYVGQGDINTRVLLELVEKYNSVK